MKVLFATKNPAKIKKYSEKLKEYGIELVSIKDLNIDIEVEENGKDAIENAYLKAKTYYKATGLPTIGLDDNLYFEGVDEEDQPGTLVRRVNGKTLDDEEMISYYTGLSKKYGGKLEGKWVYGMVLYDGEKAHEHTWSKGGFYFADKASEKRNPGYPLDSITIWPEYNKYWLELNDEEKKVINDRFFNDGVQEFLINSLNKSKK